MTEVRSFLILWLLAAAATTDAFEVLEPSEPINVRDDEALELTCTGSDPWLYCKWTFFDKDCARTVETSGDSCKISPERRIVWRGIPSIDNKCTIYISQPQVRDTGPWKCSLVTEENELAEVTFDVTVFTPTEVDFGARPFRSMVAGNEYSIECVGLGGVPAPALVAIVGAGEEVTEEDFDLAPIEEHSDGMVGGTVSKLFKFEPTKEHRHMFVKCVAFQTSGERNVFEPRFVSQEFDVVFMPTLPDDAIKTFYVDDGGTAEISLEFYSNPAPDSVVWNVVGTSDTQSLQISAGSDNERFRASYIDLADSLITANLSIDSVSAEDTAKHFYLEASNEHGRLEYGFTLELTPDPTEATYDPIQPKDDGKDEANVGTIVGIVIGVLLLLVAVTICVVFMYKQKMVCFGKKNQDLDYLGVTQRDGVAGENSSVRSSTSGHYRDNMDEVDNDLMQGGGQRGSGAQPIVRGPPPHMRPQSYMKATNRESNYPVS